MGSVDKSDMILSSTETVRKSMKRYKKTFFHLFDLAVLNASIPYNQLNQKKHSVREFQMEMEWISGQAFYWRTNRSTTS